MRVVETTGKPDAWIREIQRVRNRGAISTTVAHFLIFSLVESAITALIEVHPRLASITAAIERVEREHGGSICATLRQPALGPIAALSR